MPARRPRGEHCDEARPAAARGDACLHRWRSVDLDRVAQRSGRPHGLSAAGEGRHARERDEARRHGRQGSPGHDLPADVLGRDRHDGADTAAGIRDETAEPANGLVHQIRGVRGRKRRGSMPVQTDVERLRSLQPLERSRTLVDAEQEVAPSLCHEHRRRHRPELREARARVRPGLDRRGVPGERGCLHRGERRVALLCRDGAREPRDESGLHEPLGHERGVEVGPRLHGHDRRPRNAGDEGVEDRAAAVRDSPGADLRIRDVRPSCEPVANGARVSDLARPVDSHQPARLAVSAGIEREDGESLTGDAISLYERVHLLAVAGKPVQEHDRRPAACRNRAIREVERRGDRDAVVHRDRDVLPGGLRSRRFADDEDERGHEHREPDLQHDPEGYREPECLLESR